MSLIDLFRTVPKESAAPAPAPVGAPAPAPAPVADTSPYAGLDKLADLWKPITNAAVVPSLTDPVLTYDASKMQEAVSKASFTSGVSPETLEAAARGDAGKLREAIDMSARAAFQAGLAAASTMVNSGVSAGASRFDQGLENKLKAFQLGQQQPGLQVLQHAAVRPIVDALRAQFMTRNPTATAEQATKAAEDMMTELSASIVSERARKNAEANPTPERPKPQTNFNGFFE